jgi:hypothetical protein
MKILVVNIIERQLKSMNKTLARINFRSIVFIELLLFVLFFSMFLRAEVFSINIAGVGVKPFHILPVFIIFFCFVKYKMKVYRVRFIGWSLTAFMLLLLLESFAHMLTKGLSVGYLKGVFYCFIFSASAFLHSQYYAECVANNISFPDRYGRFMSKAALIVLTMISVKNLIFLPDIFSQYFSGLIRPKPDWNFMNFGHSINNEVVFSLMLLPFLKPIIRSGFTVFIVIIVLTMMLLTKVDAAYVFCIFLLLCYYYNYLNARFKFGNAFILFVGLFIIPLFIITAFIGGDFIDLKGGELGRYLLWNGALNTFSDLGSAEKIFGGNNLSYIISGYDELYSIGSEVMDFHNTYINTVFEFGVFILIAYIFLMLMPIVGALNQVQLKNPIAIFIAFSLLSAWFSPRGLDYLFWYFSPCLMLFRHWSCMNINSTKSTNIPAQFT